MRRLLALGLLALVALGAQGLGKEIRVPTDSLLTGQVVIAEWFYEQSRDGGSVVPRTFDAPPGPVRNSEEFDVRIEAHPGDVLVLGEGQYVADLFVFTPRLTITTDPKSSERASIWGTVEIDADGVVLDRIAVVGPRKDASSGHGIEINRLFVRSILIRDSRVADKDWTGIHIIGPRDEIDWLRVENCELVHNGLDGMDAQSVGHLVITGCTITDNGWGNDEGVGVRIGGHVASVEMTNNSIERNRFANVSRKS